MHSGRGTQWHRTGMFGEGLVEGTHLPKDKCLWRKLEMCKLSGLALLSAGAICVCFLEPWNVTAAHFSILPLISQCVLSVKDIWSSLDGSYLQTQVTWKKLLLNKLTVLFLYWNWVTFRVFQHKQEKYCRCPLFHISHILIKFFFKTSSQRSLNVLMIMWSIFGPWAL